MKPKAKQKAKYRNYVDVMKVNAIQLSLRDGKTTPWAEVKAMLEKNWANK